MSNPEVEMTLEVAVEEVLQALFGLELSYDPHLERFRSITRCLNRALRFNALEKEWSYYSDVAVLGPLVEGDRTLTLDSGVRARTIGDDALRVVDGEGWPCEWAYVLPRDALHKYAYQPGLWVSVTRSTVTFSRPVNAAEAGYSVELPVMREPLMFRLPDLPDDPNAPMPDPDPDVLAQLVDFDFPDAIVARAAYLYAQTDPVLQPRAQTLEGGFKDLMYQLIERDDANTDAPLQNEFFVPVQNTIYPESSVRAHPVADRRRRGF